MLGGEGCKYRRGPVEFARTVERESYTWSILPDARFTESPSTVYAFRNCDPMSPTFIVPLLSPAPIDPSQSLFVEHGKLPRYFFFFLAAVFFSAPLFLAKSARCARSNV